MTQSLAGRTVALAEGRQLEELARLFEAEGAVALRCPLIGMHDAPDQDSVAAWLNELCADRFGWVVLMTGEAVRRLYSAAERIGSVGQLKEALARTRTLTRGPKPGQALKEIGVTPTRSAAAPTTNGVIATLRSESLDGVTVGVTLSGAPNPALINFLQEAGADPRPVLPYVYTPAADSERILALIDLLAEGKVDALLFTSSPQVDRLFEVAVSMGIETKLRDGLKRTKVAAVGPVVAENLAGRSAPADIVPQQGFVMKNLVQLVKRALTNA